MTNRKVRLGIIGCGAIAESFYVPAINRARGEFESITFIDPNATRADLLARMVADATAATAYQEVIGDLDAAVVATPHQFHEPISVSCLNAGVHVLCEKPLGENVGAAQAIVDAAKRAGKVLAVNHTRRFHPTSQKVREMLAADQLGRVRSITYEDGSPFNWPTSSGFYFRSAGTRGVMLDKGPHVLDLVSWWLGGRLALEEAYTDSFGGPEATAYVKARLRDVTVVARMSWLTKLSNRFIIEGDRGSIEGEIYDWRNLTHVVGGSRKRIALPSSEATTQEFGARVLADFLHAVRNGSKPLVPGVETIDSAHLIDAYYARAVPFAMPWYRSVSARAA